MSLEIALQENTAAIRELIAAIQSGAVPAVATNVEAPAAKKSAAAVKEAASSGQKNTKAADPAPTAEEPAKSEAADTRATEQPTYDQVAKAITTLAKAKGRDVAVGLLKRFGVAKGPDLMPEQYADALAAATAELVE